MREQRFVIPQKGVGQQDYTVVVERSTATLATPSLRQEIMLLTFDDSYPPPPFPAQYQVFVPMPQEDGTWGWEASSIRVHFIDLSIAGRKNALCCVGMMAYESLAALTGGLPPIAWYPRVYDYGRAVLKYSKGIASQTGRVYAVHFAVWSDAVTEPFSLEGFGIITELSLAWMQT